MLSGKMTPFRNHIKHTPELLNIGHSKQTSTFSGYKVFKINFDKIYTELKETKF